MSSTATAQESIQSIEIRKEIVIQAEPQIAWAAMLEELGPGSQLPDGTPFPMKIEAWIGGRWYRDRGESGGHPHGHFWGHVQVIKAPVLLELYGPMMMSFAAINHVQYRLTPEGNATRLTLIHRAIGPIPSDMRDGMHEGWDHGVRRVKQIAESRVGVRSR